MVVTKLETMIKKNIFKNSHWNIRQCHVQLILCCVSQGEPICSQRQHILFLDKGHCIWIPKDALFCCGLSVQPLRNQWKCICGQGHHISLWTKVTTFEKFIKCWKSQRRHLWPETITGLKVFFHSSGGILKFLKFLILSFLVLEIP